MNQRFVSASAALAMMCLLCGSSAVMAEDRPAAPPTAPAATAATAAAAPVTPAPMPTVKVEPPKKPPFADVIKEAKPVEGLMNAYRKDEQVLLDVTPANLNKDFIVVISIAHGIGEGQLLGGMSWGFGDDWLWQFRKVNENIQIVRRNVRFRAASGSPEERAVKLAYTDSVLFSLPIITTTPTGGNLIDITSVFMSDLPQISQVLPGFMFAQNKSSWAEVKGFKDNLELEVAATYASGGQIELETVPDSRGLTVNVHYSISALPQTGYQPRYADDRVGHFVTVVKDFSKKSDEDRFVRYINRWDLQKNDAAAEISTPKKPITFYLEKTIPYKYRKSISDGIGEWNKAFEKAGFYNAVQVLQQQDNDDWDPEDVRYNTFRWITSSAGFAMGPSRVNPVTGQILDADIIFDADFVQFWKQEYETFTPQSIANMTGGALDLKTFVEEQKKMPQEMAHMGRFRCDLHHGMSREFAFGSIAMTALPPGPERDKETERMIQQGLKEVTMHEVGHTLGLRHNFKGSTFLTLAEMNDPAKTNATGLGASVMDYNPTFLSPKGQKQGDYYSTTIGPYDMWAIEYAYKPLAGGSDGEVAELKKIAARSGEAGLAYATDEDTRGIDPDPLSNRFDMGKDPVEYAKTRAQVITDLYPDLVKRVVPDGDGYERARQAFGILLGNYGNAMHFASRYIGGLNTSRSHKGDKEAKAPFQVVDAAKQREALALLEQQVFNDKPFNFPPELYNQLAPTRWNHWGLNTPLRSDYAVHDVIAMWQERILYQLLSPLTLDRLHDSELKIAPDQDAFTTAELLERLTKAIFAEVDNMPAGQYTPRKPAITSLRRNLQRVYLKRLSNIAMGEAGAPQDCQTIAYAQLQGLKERTTKVLAGPVTLDAYSRAHLQESADRMTKVIDARLMLSQP